jgi:hypothetical protein
MLSFRHYAAAIFSIIFDFRFHFHIIDFRHFAITISWLIADYFAFIFDISLFFATPPPFSLIRRLPLRRRRQPDDTPFTLSCHFHIFRRRR